MKNLLFIPLLILLISCKEKHYTPEFDQVCQLQVFNSKSSVQSHSSGGFFLIAGAWSSETREITEYYFYAKNRKDEYCRFSISPNQIKIKFDTCRIPTVRFNLNKTTEFSLNKIFSDASIMRSCLHWINENSITITCNSEQFPENINLQSLQ